MRDSNQGLAQLPGPGSHPPLPNPNASMVSTPATSNATLSTSFSSSSSTSYHPPPGGSPSVTLYSSAPSSVTNPGSSMTSPRDPASMTSSPDKQSKTIPHQNQQQGQTPSQTTAGSPAMSSGGTAHNTPALANASLKRKQVGGDATSPVVGHQQQPQDGSGSGPSAGNAGTGAKRGARKRGRTNTTGGA